MQDVLIADSTRARYTIEERWGGDGPGDRYLATDRRLGRAVVVWMVTAPDGDARREGLLRLARRCAGLTHPSFLRVVDAVVRADSVLVAVEAPSGPRVMREHREAPGATAAQTAEWALHLGRALEQAQLLELSPRTADVQHVYTDAASGLRVDPLGLLAEHSAALAVPLLTAVLAAMAPHSGANREWDALAATGSGWNTRGSFHERDLAGFLSELQRISNGVQLVAPVRGVADEITTVLRAAAAPITAATGGSRTVNNTVGKQGGGVRSGVWRTAMWSAAIAVLLVCGTLVASVWGGSPPEADPLTPNAVAGPSVTDSTGKATLTLTPERDARVRVTVDDAKKFSGVLRAGETRSWQGDVRVHVWSADSKALRVKVNGHDLGMLSAAVGHPEWNTVDWGWPVGWKP